MRGNETLSQELARLEAALSAAQTRNQELTEEAQQLREANADLCVERDAADVLLGEAMDALRRRI